MSEFIFYAKLYQRQSGPRPVSLVIEFRCQTFNHNERVGWIRLNEDLAAGHLKNEDNRASWRKTAPLAFETPVALFTITRDYVPSDAGPTAKYARLEERPCPTLGYLYDGVTIVNLG
ncbi:hypothetical protein EVAR_93234_1 [Eumeta japonica]|uniref:Uncharacterized protein n=1 Tax=Eumeta variegata TaxID=151549 RepID=A0A4C1TYY0_EUMVA|nr:hypothetical protein EVAR_93234_1 [Eumeta japonica]